MSAFLAATAPNPWSRILDALEKKVNRHSYDTWLKPLRYSHTTGATLFVRVPAPEFREMGERYADLIREAIENLGLEIKDVEFIIAEDSPAAATAIRHNGGFAPPAAGPAPQQARFDFDSAAQLNQRYTFDAFVTGGRQSVCPRRRAGGCRATFQGLQSAVSLRRSGNGQDPPDAGDRPPGQAAEPRLFDLLRLQREVHQ